MDNTRTASRAARAENPLTHSYTALARDVRRLGLQDRTRWFYGSLLAGLLLALGGAVTGSLLLDDSWLQLLVAVALAVIFTQFAFLAHEASHRQVLVSGPANDRVGWVLGVAFVGISYSWWVNKHSRHHGNPNQRGKDPDVAPGALSFVEEDAARHHGLAGWFTARQGTLFFPLLLLEGLNLHAKSVQSLWQNRRSPGQRLELAVLIARFVLYVAAIFWVLPVGIGCAFLGVQLAVFGLYMGASFAPNHIAMPIIAPEERLDFFTKQVRTSRNVTGGWWATALMGGLNYQIEHHLFPSMSRPHLAEARRLVRAHCRTLDVPYTETNLVRAWGIVVRHLDRVGLGARDSFQCPIATKLR